MRPWMLTIGLLVTLVTVCCGGGSSGSGSTPPASHHIDLSWGASSSTIVGYNVYRGTQSGGPYSKLSSQAETSLQFTDKTVTAGNTYYYVVTAVDSNAVESNYSNEASAAVSFP